MTCCWRWCKVPVPIWVVEYEWREALREVCHSVKSMAKLGLALQKPTYTNCQFVSTITLVIYTLHTTRPNPAESYRLMSVLEDYLSTSGSEKRLG